MEVGRVDILALSQKESFQFFTTEYNANYGFSYTVLRGVCSQFAEHFYHERVMNFVKCFFFIN